VFYWHTTAISNGSHTVSATAYNSGGSSLGSTSSTVTVANGGAVTLSSPSNGSTVSGAVTINVSNGPSTAWSNVYINGQYQNSTPPNTFTWHTNAISNGQYTVSATAYNSSGTAIGSTQSAVTVANGSTAAASGAVTLTSPSSGSTVSGNVNIAAAEGSGVGWVNFYVDGNYLKSSPPLSFSWNSGSVSNGNHTISAEAFNTSSNEIGSSSATVTVKNSGVASTSHFYTLPPGSSLPSGSACASAVNAAGPSTEVRPDNYTANHTVPSDNLSNMRTTTNNGGAAPHSFDRVDGNYTGTTDQILRWGACKWGFDEDLVRAIAANETWWHESGHGDLTYSTGECPSGAVWTGSECALSYGIMQIKSTDFSYTFPDSHTSTAFAVDYNLAYERACFEGKIGYLSQRSSDYPNGDENNMLWGCVDEWYSGSWWDGSDDTYITQIKGLISSKPWLSSNFLQ
ncbi:MAG TPA: Ig-like domain-containing protein, partial [Candidatus Binataceae bacterium]|nr:Ig-like domain-containing protein [Candidatus Binataceae bacterium]